MHSRIFQVCAKPIDKDDYITEDYYYDHWFLHQIADYVDDDCDRDESIEWLADCAKGYAVEQDNNGYYLVVNNKEEYFKNTYERFVGALKNIGTPTIAQFANGLDLWNFKDAYEEKFGFYVELCYDECSHDLMTLDEFVRHVDVLSKWYIGSVIDYHC